MRKAKTSMNYTKNFRRVFRCGYCDLQNIFRGIEPQFYNAGVYGWNCDLYVDYSTDTVITTGYRNMRGERIPSALIEKYNERAKATAYEDRFELVQDFYKELATL